jgi:hypothetical protein
LVVFFQSAEPCDSWVVVLCIFCDQYQRAAIIPNSSSSNGKEKEEKKSVKQERCPEPVKGKRSVGRPKDSKNKKSEKPTLSPELLRIQLVLQAFGSSERRFEGTVSGNGGHFRDYPSAWKVLQTGWQFVSKFRFDAALYEPFTGKYCGRGAHPKYGDKVDVRKMKRNI